MTNWINNIISIFKTNEAARKSKYGFDKIAVGETVVFPHKVRQRVTNYHRLRSSLDYWKKSSPATKWKLKAERKAVLVKRIK